MKRITLLMALLLTIVLGTQAQNGKRILVTYFSWSNNTKVLAEEIQRQTHGDIYRIEPKVPYTTDYNTLAYQISNKEKEDNARPELKDTNAKINDYDIIFVGCPVWWFDAPMIIHSFLECKEYDFSGKTVIPFCTYYTATYETLNDIINATPKSEHLEGLGMRGASSYNTQTITNWLDRIGISNIVSGINDVSIDNANKGSKGTYTLDGKRLGENASLSQGVYIQDGKKIVKQ